jgi:hypothetical protein
LFQIKDENLEAAVQAEAVENCRFSEEAGRQLRNYHAASDGAGEGRRRNPTVERQNQVLPLRQHSESPSSAEAAGIMELKADIVWKILF